MLLEIDYDAPSRYCRAVDTATLAFGRAEQREDLTGVPDAKRAERIAALKRLLAEPPQPGTNTVLVAHDFNIRYTTNIGLNEGQAAIFAPTGPEGYTLVAEVLEPPTGNQGARRVWSDFIGRIWVSEWNAGQVAVYDPANGSWREWKLPGDTPRAYAVYVDEQNAVWLSDFGANALVRFDPASEAFTGLPLPSASGSVRQILGRPGEVWGAESSVDKLVVIRQ